MTDKSAVAPKGFKLWWTAIRPYAFPASVIPVLYGSVLAVWLNPGEVDFNFFVFFLTLIGCMLIHVGTNLINDIYDYKKGIDVEDEEIGIPHGGSLVLSKGFMTVRQMSYGAFVSVLLAFVIGLILYFLRGEFVLYLMVFGLFSAVFYTAAPISLKYKALGDIQVFISFGTGMTIGAYMVQTGKFSWIPVILSIPLGLFIDAILHSNNLRDLKFDKTFGIKTLPILIGEKLSKYFYVFIVLGAYLSIVIFVVFKILPVFALLNFITLPAAFKLIKILNNIPQESKSRFEVGTRVNVGTAQLSMQFGIATIIGILLHIFIF